MLEAEVPGPQVGAGGTGLLPAEAEEAEDGVGGREQAGGAVVGLGPGAASVRRRGGCTVCCFSRRSAQDPLHELFVCDGSCQGLSGRPGPGWGRGVLRTQVSRLSARGPRPCC